MAKSAKAPKIGEVRVLSELGNVLKGQLMPQQDEKGNPVAYRIFGWVDKKSQETKQAISMLVAVDGHGTVEATGFGTRVVEAFVDRMYLDPAKVEWVEFRVPQVGDFVRMTGSHTEKFKKLSKSKNPVLKAGFWSKGFKVLSPADIVIRTAPPKPKSLEALKATWARSRKSREIGDAF